MRANKYILNEEIIDDIWKYFITNNYDINKSKIENGNLIVIDNGFHKFGYVNQLFNILKSNNLFCILL